MVKYTLVYFDFKGRGELLRLIFVASGQHFEERRLTYSPDYSNPAPDWKAYRADTPFGHLPVLEIAEDEKKPEQVKRLAESLAIGKRSIFDSSSKQV